MPEYQRRLKSIRSLGVSAPPCRRLSCACVSVSLVGGRPALLCGWLLKCAAHGGVLCCAMRAAAVRKDYDEERKARLPELLATLPPSEAKLVDSYADNYALFNTPSPGRWTCTICGDDRCEIVQHPILKVPICEVRMHPAPPPCAESLP